MNDSELAAKLAGLNAGRIRIQEVTLIDPCQVWVTVPGVTVNVPASDLLALSRAVCEAAGLRVVETSCEGCESEHTEAHCMNCSRMVAVTDNYMPKVPSQANDGAAKKGGVE